MQFDTTPPLPPWKDPKKLGLAVFAAFVFQILVLSALTAKGLVPRFTSTRVRLEVTGLATTGWRDNNHFEIQFQASKFSDDHPLVKEAPRQRKSMNYPLEKSPPKEVFVHLKFLPQENLWVPTKYALQPPPEGRFLKGIWRYHNLIEFGAEDFYFREGNGLIYQEALAARKLDAEIYLAPNGKCQLKSLVILEKAHTFKGPGKEFELNKQP